MPESSSWVSATFAGPDLASGRRVGVAEMQVGRRDDEGEEDPDGEDGGEDAAPDDPSRPALPALVSPGAAVHASTVHRRADRGEDDREQGDRDRGRDEGDQKAAEAHGTQERQGRDHECEQADRDGRAAEHDGAPRGPHRDPDRRVVVASVVALLAPADDDQQRVVDRYPEPDQGHEELQDRGQVGDAREAVEQQERDGDRADRHQQRREREGRPEHEHEDDQRADGGDQELDDHADAAVLAAVGAQSVDARHPHDGAGDLDVLHPPFELLHGLLVAPERVVARREEGVGEGHPAVLGGEGGVAGRAEAGDPGAGDRGLHLAFHPSQVVADPGLVGVGAVRQSGRRRGAATCRRRCRTCRRSRRWCPSPRGLGR